MPNYNLNQSKKIKQKLKKQNYFCKEIDSVIWVLLIFPNH